MLKLKIKNSWIITATLILLFAFVFLIINTYNLTLSKSKLNHQKKQLEMVKSAVSGIRLYVGHIVHDLSYLSKTKITDKNYIEEILEDKFIKSVFVLNENNMLLESEGDEVPLWLNSEVKAFDKNFKPENSDDLFNQCWFSRVMPLSEDDLSSEYLFLIILKKPFENRITNTRNYVGAVVSFKWLMNNFVLSLRLTEHDFAWVLDSEGRLIFHPNHEEMLLNNISDVSNDCASCHKSFDVQKKMLVNGESLDEYYIEGEPHKIMAYAPLNLNQQKWVLAISTYLPFVVNDVMNSFIFVFVVSAGIILLILGMGYGFYKINLKRIQAEEAERHYLQAQSYQEKLNQASKLASIGELVDSVAHEINTPTGIISIISDTMLMMDCAQSKCMEDIKLIKDQTKRIKNYTKSLLGFSRRMPFQPELNNLIELINESIFLVSPKLKSNRVQLEKQLPADFPQFIFDRARIEQVIVNLLNNSIDFVEVNGLIIINLEIIYSEEEQKSVKWAVLSIKDNGAGISPENMQSIFEPFFSTKPIAKGTGLGLSISKAIVERHEGKIIVESELDKGTNIKVFLPMQNGNDK